MLALALAGALVLAGGFPAPAEAHGPLAPVALDYLARVSEAPPGLEARIVDGDQQMWLRVPARETVVVLDYRGAPYLRFSRAGVEVNQDSAMYYLNMTPFAERPPASLGPGTPAKWKLLSAGHEYGWHDGRVHALAAVALAPAASFVGRWRIPVVVDGRPSAITGVLWHDGAPSIVWFWPIAVLLMGVLAAWRVRREALDRWTARFLALGALGAIAAAAIGRGLHGRPTVSVVQLVELGIVLGFVGWGTFRIACQRPGFFSYLAIAVVALWQGLALLPTLLNGFVLIAVPALVARASTVVALGAAAGLILMAFRLHDYELDSDADARRVQREDEDACELA